MTSMQFVKKMVLIPHDEYNSWKESKRVGSNSTHLSESLPPESLNNISNNDQLPVLKDRAVLSEAEDQDGGLQQVRDKPYQELVSKIGSTLLDLLVSKGAQSIQNFMGA